MFEVIASYTLSHVLLAGSGGAAAGVGAAYGAYKYNNNKKNDNKEQILRQLEEHLLALYKELPEAAKRFAIITADNAQEILENSKNIYSSILDDEKELSKQIQSIDARNLNLHNADEILETFVKLTKDNLQIIIAELNNRQEIIASTTAELKIVQDKLDVAAEDLAAAVKTQEDLQDKLDSQIDVKESSVENIKQSRYTKKLEETTKELTSQLSLSTRENDALQAKNEALEAENARLRHMVASLRAQQQGSDAQSFNPSPRM